MGVGGGGRQETSFVKDLWLCDIAVPGNRACTVESGWPVREKNRIMLVIAVIGFRIEVLQYSLNMILKDWKGFSLANFLVEEKLNIFSQKSAGWFNLYSENHW